MARPQDKILGKCVMCKRNLLIDEENGMCISCENDALRKKITELEIILAQYRRERKEMVGTHE